jgi:hypothetical protein
MVELGSFLRAFEVLERQHQGEDLELDWFAVDRKHFIYLLFSTDAIHSQEWGRLPKFSQPLNSMPQFSQPLNSMPQLGQLRQHPPTRPLLPANSRPVFRSRTCPGTPPLRPHIHHFLHDLLYSPIRAIPQDPPPCLLIHLVRQPLHRPPNIAAPLIPLHVHGEKKQSQARVRWRNWTWME